MLNMIFNVVLGGLTSLFTTLFINKKQSQQEDDRLKNSIDTQVRVAKMQISMELNNANKIKWLDETRKKITNFITACEKYNDMYELSALNSIGASDLRFKISNIAIMLQTYIVNDKSVGSRLIDKIQAIVNITKDEEGNLPKEQLVEILGLSETYFEQQFKELTTIKDD